MTGEPVIDRRRSAGRAAAIPRAGLVAPIALGLISLAGLLLFFMYRSDYAIDDAWITYRYAENIARGLGFVYNPGEAVMGTSTPLYTLLLALIDWLGLSVPVASQTIGLASMLGTLVAIYLLGREIHSETTGLLAAALLVSMQIFTRTATFGMETPLYVLMIALSFLAYARDRLTLATIFAAVCVLLRLDGALVIVTLLAAHLLLRREIPWKQGLIYALLVGPWFLFSLAYFGRPFPSSFYAKRAHTHFTLLTWMPEWLLTQAYAALAALGAVVGIATVRARAAALPMGLWAGGYVLMYTLSALQGYEWYRTPLSLPLALFSALAIVEVATRLLAGRLQRLAAIALVAGVLVAQDGFRTLNWLQGDRGIVGVEATRWAAARYIAENVPDDAAIVTGGIGMVGYLSGNYILDAMGLVSPQFVSVEGTLEDPEAVPVPRYLETIIEEERPEYVFDGFWLPAGSEVPDFMEGDYAVVERWPLGSGPGALQFILMQRTTP